VTFRATVRLDGKTATGIEVPPDVVSALGSHKRPPVTVTINGHTYRSTIASMGGRFMLPLSAENRRSAGVEAGDEVEVDVELDREPRDVEVPAELAEALNRQPLAKQRFEALSNSRKRVHTLAVEGAKTEETRQRRIEKAIAALLQA
jgi:hypothetical protein